MTTEDEEFEFRHRLEQEAAPPKPLKIGVEGFSDAMRSTMKSKGWIERNAAAFGNFPRQVYEGVKQMSGNADPTSIRATKVMEEEAPVGALAGGLSTVALSALVPGSQGILGQAALGGATGLAMPTEGDESRVKNALIGGAAGGGTAAALKAAAPAVSKLFQGSAAKAAGIESQNSVRDATLKAAQAEGYVVPPSAAGGGSVNKLLESVGGKAATGQEAAIRNQQVTNKIARREAGLAEDAPISEKTLEAARNKLAEPYREVAAVSPRAASALEQLKEARNEAKTYWNHYGVSKDPKSLKEAQRFDDKAEVLEKLINKEATKVGSPDLLDRLKESRVALAKNYDVEHALNVGSGDIDARALGRMLDKRGEARMTGGLGTIAKFAEAFSPYAREASGIPPPGVSKLAPYASIALGGLGAGASEHYTGTPYGMAAAALPLLSGPARSIALSKLMQPNPSYNGSGALRLADLATRNRALPLAASGGAVNYANQ